MALSFDNEAVMMKKKKYTLYPVIVALILVGQMAFSHGKSDDKERGVRLKENTAGSKGRKCALIIGINEYEGRKSLKNPVPDAQAVEGVLLNKFGYKSSDVTTLYNDEATWESINEKLKGYLGEEGLQEGDSLFVFFSGHGWSDNLDMYWLPVDFGTDLKNGEIKKESKNKIPMSQIQAFLSRCKAKHIFVVADSCFAGKYISLFERESDPHNYDKKSRQILISGREWALDENVSDEKYDAHSPFAKSFLKFLENNWNEFTAETIIDQVLSDFRTDFNQQPDGGALNYVGDEGGQFVFTPEYTAKEFEWAQKVKKLLNQKDNLKSETMRRDLLNNCRLFLDNNPSPTYRLSEPDKQLKALIVELEKTIKITKKLKGQYEVWIKMHKKEEKIEESKILLKDFKEAPWDEYLLSMREHVEKYIVEMFEDDYDKWENNTNDEKVKRKKKERMTVNLLNMYRDFKHIESKVEEVQTYFIENFKINHLYFSIAWGVSPMKISSPNSGSELFNFYSGNFEIGYHLKLGYFLNKPTFLTPFFFNSYQLKDEISLNLTRSNYPLIVKIGNVNLMGFGVKLGYKGFKLRFSYQRYYFNIREIKNQSNNMPFDFIEITHKNYAETFTFGYELSLKITSRLYFMIGVMAATKYKSLFTYEITINHETKANFTISSHFGKGLLGFEFYL